MSGESFKIAFAEAYGPSAVERLRKVGEVTLLEDCDPVSLKRGVRDCHALLVRTASRVTRAVIEQGSNLRVIARGGIGVDNIDVAAARERGIQVVHTPWAATDAVADLTVGLILNLHRGIHTSDRMVRAGRFTEARRLETRPELSQLVLGIVGMGRIGTAVGRRGCRGLGMRVLYNDIRPIDGLDFQATPTTKDDLYAGSDIISLHVPLTDQTRGLIGVEALAKFKPGAFLVNTARGAVVDAVALVDALRTGRLAGAALDVYDPEPPSPDHPLLSAPNTLLTAHIGARTAAAQARMDDVVDDVIRVLHGEPPRYPVQLPG
jgi:D-3-phosphoglycerate dehydrogenase